MGAEDKDLELLGELIRATEEGRLVWRPTARIDEFSTSFKGRFSFLVRKEVDGCSLRLLDEDDRELLVIPEPRSALPPMPPSVSQLFDLARRGGLRVDKAVDEILQELKHA